MAYLLRSRVPDLWRLDAPINVGQIQLNRDHPLAAGLTSLYFPGIASAASLPNLAGIGGDLVPFTATNQGLVAGPFGVEAQTPTNVTYYSTALPVAMQPTSTASVWFYGRKLAAGAGSNPPLFGVFPNNTNSSPWFTYSINDYVQTQPGVFYSFSSSGSASLGSSTNTSWTIGGLYNICASITLGGALALYVNGAVTTGTATAGSFNYTASAQVGIGAGQGNTATDIANAGAVICATWNRALTAAEAQQLNLDPFCLLRPATSRSRLFVTPWVPAGRQFGRTYLRR